MSFVRPARVLVITALSFAALSRCGSAPSPSPSPSTNVPVVSFKQRDLPLESLDGLSSAVFGEDNSLLLLGAVTWKSPDRNVPLELAGLVGRWEGFDLGLPVPRDIRSVLVVREVHRDRILVTSWSGPDCQTTYTLHEAIYPVRKTDFGYEIISETVWESFPMMPGTRVTGRTSYRYDARRDELSGTLRLLGTERPLEFSRGKAFVRHPDYERYLSSLGIVAERYDDQTLLRYGDGWLVYLPRGYAEYPERKWPLIYFFHGSGDIGADVTVLAKASPFMYVRQGHDLDAVIVAPALRKANANRSFPQEYLTRALDAAIARYHVDTKRVSVTGLSMGGEAAFAFALGNPDRVHKSAPLCFGDAALNDRIATYGFAPLPRPYSKARHVSFRVVQGSSDSIMPPEAARDTVEAMRAEGVDASLIMLQGRSHDVWTETYSDPAFYEWLLGE